MNANPKGDWEISDLETVKASLTHHVSYLLSGNQPSRGSQSQAAR